MDQNDWTNKNETEITECYKLSNLEKLVGTHNV